MDTSTSMIRTRNLLLQGPIKSMPYFTNMFAVFKALPGVCSSYDWLISDIECIWFENDDLDNDFQGSDERFASQPMFIAGEELDELLRSNEIQFDWAVFSALRKGTKSESRKVPYADGNPDFWIGSPKPQLPEAEFEIVCWDSGSTLLIGIPADLAATFKITFPEAIDLDERNRRASAQTELI